MTRNILYGGQLAGGVECQKSEREGEQQLEDVPTTPIEVNINTTSTHPTLHIWLRLKHSGSFDPAVLSSSFSAYYYRSFARGHDNAHSFHSSIHEEGCAVKHGLFGELSVSRYGITKVHRGDMASWGEGSATSSYDRRHCRRHQRRKARSHGRPHCALEFPLSSTNIPRMEEIQPRREVQQHVQGTVFDQGVVMDQTIICVRPTFTGKLQFH